MPLFAYVGVSAFNLYQDTCYCGRGLQDLIQVQPENSIHLLVTDSSSRHRPSKPTYSKRNIEFFLSVDQPNLLPLSVSLLIFYRNASWRALFSFRDFLSRKVLLLGCSGLNFLCQLSIPQPRRIDRQLYRYYDLAMDVELCPGVLADVVPKWNNWKQCGARFVIPPSPDKDSEAQSLSRKFLPSPTYG